MSTTNLAKYEAARYALAQCKAVDEVKSFIDKSAAMQAYAKMAKDKGLEVDAAEIRIRAERRLGEMLAATEKNTGAKGIGKSAVVADDRTLTLSEVGISKDLSSRAQKLAAVPDEVFESELSDHRERISQEGERVTARLESLSGKKTTDEKSNSEVDELREMLHELTIQLEEANTEIQSLSAVVNALDDDKLKAALAEAKKHAEMNRVLTSQNNGLLNKSNEYIKSAKHWENKYRQLAKQLKVVA